MRKLQAGCHEWEIGRLKPDATIVTNPRVRPKGTFSRKITSDLAHMPLLELITSSGLGSLLGMRHALEPDHLAAVSTLVTGERSSVRAALLGVCWGLGHTLSLVIVGTILVLLRAEMPARVADFFELAVAVMLIGL